LNSTTDTNDDKWRLSKTTAAAAAAAAASAVPFHTLTFASDLISFNCATAVGIYASQCMAWNDV
jgi:hypothetical protein